jgi:hypothetical protein
MAGWCQVGGGNLAYTGKNPFIPIDAVNDFRFTFMDIMPYYSLDSQPLYQYLAEIS